MRKSGTIRGLVTAVSAGMLLFASLSCTTQEDKKTTVRESADTGTPRTLTFSDSGQKLGSTGSWDVSLADIDGDGDMDAGFNGALWINDGTGSFTQHPKSFGPAGKGIFFADVNRDGAPDILCDNMLYRNDGRGGFQSAQSVPSDIPMDYVYAADLSGDGFTDLITASAQEDRILLNDRTGNFTAAGTTRGGWSQARYAAGDFTGDGIIDIFIAIPHSPPPAMSHTDNLLLTGNGNGDFTVKPVPIYIMLSRGAAAFDADGDKDLDIAIGCGITGGKLLLNDGKGGFTDSGLQLNTSLRASDVRAADLDNDGDTDLFFANGQPLDFGQPNRIWLNDGTGKFSDSGLTAGSLNSIMAALADLNGDSRIDAIIANVDVRTGRAPVEVWFNTADGK